MATLSALSRPVEKHWPQLGFSSHCTSSWSHQKWQKTDKKIWEVQVCKASVWNVKNHLVFDIRITVSLENKWCWGGQLHKTFLCEHTAEIINCKTCLHILRNVVKEGHFSVLHSWKNIDCGYCVSTQDVETNQEINEQKSWLVTIPIKAATSEISRGCYLHYNGI